MYFDTKPCQVCGAEVELRPRDPGPLDKTGADPVKDPDGTVDERVCTNPDCATHQDGPEAPAP